MHHNYSIYINGYPGMGKLAVADALAKLIPRAKILHNHLMIDPVAALVDRDRPEYHAICARGPSAATSWTSSPRRRRPRT